MEEFSKLSDRSHWANHYRLKDFEQSGESVQKQLAQYLEAAWSREFDRVLPQGSPEERLAQWQSELEGPKDVSDTGLIRRDLIERMVDRSNKLHDPRYAGHQVAVPFPELAWLQATTSLLNNGMAIDEMGPASSPMEEAVMRSIAEFMGLGSEANGVLCHGGTLANFNGASSGATAALSRQRLARWHEQALCVVGQRSGTLLCGACGSGHGLGRWGHL